MEGLVPISSHRLRILPSNLSKAGNVMSASNCSSSSSTLVASSTVNTNPLLQPLSNNTE